ncbi:hypothetical protein HMPREF1049_0283 [Fusobacterium necrophorum subsp. funduliforme ATCC 51357]|nr:hypothetical protein HMPREF1049_0283 [Fusobacterium necrophorum subsp. funduliforme ATCC 51357]
MDHLFSPYILENKDIICFLVWNVEERKLMEYYIKAKKYYSDERREYFATK